MKTGLVLGKFLPLHNGHIALIEFALQRCDHLIVLLCYTNKESIPGSLRKDWLLSTFHTEPRITIAEVLYDENELPATSVSSREASAAWATYIQNTFPEVNVFFSSEPYGEYVADYLHIENRSFDQPRKKVPVSASAILKNPFASWEFISKAAQPFFVKKICISGSESTGKSTLTEKLANHFATAFVPEMAREVIGKTEDVQFDHLLQIATLHAKTINEKTSIANKLLICDTDVYITRSYSKFLFNRPLELPEWVERANHFDLHIFLDTDCPFIQDGTRLSEAERNRLSYYHKTELQEAHIPFVVITGNWQQRFNKSVTLIENTLLK